MNPVGDRKGFARLRGQLLCCTALSGMALVLFPSNRAAAISASDATSAVNAAASSSGSTTTVTMAPGANRAVISWKSLTVDSPEVLKFLFNGKDGVALNVVTGTGPGTAKAQIFGKLLGCVAACPNYGGNIWISAPDGVLIGNGAVINTGGLLATTSPLSLSTSNFIAGNEPTSGTNHVFEFSDGKGAVTVGDAHITLHGGTLALIAPTVTTATNSAVDGTGSVLYAATNAFKISLAPDGSNWDLVSFEVPAGHGSSAPGELISLAGNT